MLPSIGSGRAAATAIVGPVAVGVAAAIVLALAGSALAPLFLAGAVAWLVLCMAAWDRVWPAWAHLVLRRPRPAPFDAAYGRVLHRFDSMAVGGDASALWADVQALEAWRTYRTAPVIDLLGAWFDLGPRESDAHCAGARRYVTNPEPSAGSPVSAASPRPYLSRHQVRSRR